MTADLTNLHDVEKMIAQCEQELRETEAHSNKLIGRLEILLTLKANLEGQQAVEPNGYKSLEEVFRG